jgi:hypothetical protein
MLRAIEAIKVSAQQLVTVDSGCSSGGNQPARLGLVWVD